MVDERKEYAYEKDRTPTKNKVVTLRMSGEEYKRLRDYSEDHQQTITDTIKEGVFLLYMTYD